MLLRARLMFFFEKVRSRRFVTSEVSVTPGGKELTSASLHTTPLRPASSSASLPGLRRVQGAGDGLLLRRTPADGDPLPHQGTPLFFLTPS